MQSLGESILIRTKFSPPRTLRSPVHRPRAEAELSASVGAALTLVKSPAGFGKTTVLSMWRQSLINQGHAVAWLTLDQDDNDENRFVQYLGSALAATCSEGAEQIQRLGRNVSARVLLTSVINLIDQEETSITLILDDYDVITDRQVHSQMAFLLRHIPHNLNVVLACRCDPPLELGSLRTHGSLKEITVNSLRLLRTETQAILEGVLQKHVNIDDSRAIHDAAEGWVAGVHIAALVVPNHLSVKRAIAALPRHPHALGEYLMEHVLGRLPESLVEFMLRCSRPTRLCADLCRHLTDDDQAKQKLDTLVQSNLFLAPIDEEGEWFRFHGLFADFLRAALLRLRPDEVAALDVKATEWFSSRGLWAEAVRHALDAQRVDLAADWLERCALDELRGSRVREFLGWVNKLPDEVLDERPALRISHVWALILILQTEEALALGLKVERRLMEKGGPEAERLLPILKSQRVSIYSLQDRIEDGMRLGQEVWAERFPGQLRPAGGFNWEDEAFLSCLIYFETQVGNRSEARRYRDFYDPGEVDDNPFLRSYRSCVTAALEIRDLHIHAAARRLEEGLAAGEQLAGRRSFAATLLAALLASIYCEWNRLDAVDELLANRLDIVDDACYLEPVRSVYLSLARRHMADGNHTSGHNTLSRAESLALRRRWPRLLAACLAMRVELWTRQGQIADAHLCLERLVALAGDSTISHCHRAELDHLVLSARVQVLLATGEAAQALDLLQADANGAPPERVTQHPHDRVQHDLLRARTLNALGDVVAAVAALKCSIGVVEQEGLVRRLLEAGGEMIDVLIRLSDELPRHQRAVISEAIAELRSRAAGPGAVSNNCLSLREQRILALVSDEKTNKQIARELTLAPETVKWHLKNIFRKLHVADRAQAASLARQMQAEAVEPARPSPGSPR